jgi:hypothetical protein
VKEERSTLDPTGLGPEIFGTEVMLLTFRPTDPQFDKLSSWSWLIHAKFQKISSTNDNDDSANCTDYHILISRLVSKTEDSQKVCCMLLRNKIYCYRTSVFPH